RHHAPPGACGGRVDWAVAGRAWLLPLGAQAPRPRRGRGGPVSTPEIPRDGSESDREPEPATHRIDLSALAWRRSTRPADRPDGEPDVDATHGVEQHGGRQTRADE